MMEAYGEDDDQERYEVELEGPEPSRDGVVNVGGIVTEMFGCWWFFDAACANLGCDCAPVTLLEVLSGTEATSHQEVTSAHVGLVGRLWDHYWSGEGLISQTSVEIRSACPDCLVYGHEHVETLWAAANQLSGELGEALAAYHCEVSLGQARWAG